MNETSRAGSSEVPLAGWRVVVTRPRHQSTALVEALRRLGASVVEFPTIAIADPQDGGRALEEAARRLDDYDWVVFTSENAVDRFVGVLNSPGDLARVRVAAIGAGTAEALANRGVEVALVPSRFIAEALVEAFPSTSAGGRVLLPRAAVARDVVPEGLSKLGWHVDLVEAYRTIAVEPSNEARADAKSADVTTFTSSSTVTGFFAFSRVSDLAPVVATIGPITSRTARAAGIGVDVEAQVHSVDGLVAAVCAWAASNDRPFAAGRRRP